MSNPTVEGFFDTAVRTASAGAKFDNIGDTISGVIVDQFLMDATDFATKKPKVDARTGEVVQQLAVVVSTNLRGWQLANAPWIDSNDHSKGRKDPSQDNGNRTIFVEPFTNIHAAIGQATAEANGGTPTGLLNGSQFGVRFVQTEDTGKGNPLKKYQAFYKPAAASDQFFPQQEAPQQPAPAQQAPPAQPTPAPAPPAQQDPFGAPPAQPQGFAYGSNDQAQPPAQQAAPQQDPWATPTQVDEPPF